jgi:hypothetical protein
LHKPACARLAARRLAGLQSSVTQGGPGKLVRMDYDLDSETRFALLMEKVRRRVDQRRRLKRFTATTMLLILASFSASLVFGMLSLLP